MKKCIYFLIIFISIISFSCMLTLKDFPDGTYLYYTEVSDEEKKTLPNWDIWEDSNAEYYFFYRFELERWDLHPKLFWIPFAADLKQDEIKHSRSPWATYRGIFRVEVYRSINKRKEEK